MDRSGSGSGAGAFSSWSGAASWAESALSGLSEKAQATYEKVQTQGVSDLELGESASQWASWAKGAADRAAKGVAQGIEKAGSAEWGNNLGEKAKAWQADMTSTLGKVTSDLSVAGSGLSEHAKLAQQKAAMFANSAQEGLAKSASGLGSGLGSMGALAMSPGKLLRSGGIFMLGMMLISLSFSFLPMLPIQPQKFALLFAIGSMTTLGSVASLKGPAAFLSAILVRDKLVFTIMYAVGLVGVFWATLIAKSYVFTALFALMQATGLLYFLASFVPGGKVVLNFFGRLGSRAARMLIWRK